MSEFNLENVTTFTNVETNEMEEEEGMHFVSFTYKKLKLIVAIVKNSVFILMSVSFQKIFRLMTY